MPPIFIAVIVLAVIILITGVAIFCYVSNNRLTVAEYEIDAKIQSDLKIVHLSDLHAKQFGKKNRRLLAKIKGLKPDLIAFTGDIIHKYRKRDLLVATLLMQELCEIAPVVFVSGNHEKRNKNYRFLVEKLREAGACVLDNQSVEMMGISISGLDCSSLKNDTIYALESRGEFKLLLAHMPRFFSRYASADFDLVLCGHAHGGQWRIPFTDKGLYAPGEGVLPKYCRGLHEENGSKMIVSCGLGNSQFPLRLFNPPQIVLVNLKSNLLDVDG